jgi:ankyrin repeat protein
MPILSESILRRLRAPAAVALLAAFSFPAPPAQAEKQAQAPAFAKQEEAIAAAMRGNSGNLSRLLERGEASPNAVDKHGNSLLILAVRDGHKEAAAAILRFRPELNHRNKNGDSALMFAAMRGDMDMLDLLLSSGAKTNPPADKKTAWTALHYASLEGKLPAVERLLAAGADINALTPNQSNALMLAARNGHIDIVRRLLQTPIDLNCRNDRGMNAEEWARSKGNTQIADLIAQARAAKKRS